MEIIKNTEKLSKSDKYLWEDIHFITDLVRTKYFEKKECLKNLNKELGKCENKICEEKLKIKIDAVDEHLQDLSYICACIDILFEKQLLLSK